MVYFCQGPQNAVLAWRLCCVLGWSGEELSTTDLAGGEQVGSAAWPIAGLEDIKQGEQDLPGRLDVGHLHAEEQLHSLHMAHHDNVKVQWSSRWQQTWQEVYNNGVCIRPCQGTASAQS